MATQEKTWNVANRLHSQKDSDNPEVNHIIAGADEIYDDAKGAKQSDINAQADAALADRYTKAETYSKEQLDALITTPDVNYVTVATFADLPQTGEADTIYRVSSYDGTQVDVSKYALYAWNGATYQLLAVRSAVGEVFDVSEYNTGATYETLTAALADVPASVQRGGMSIKFILRTNTGTEEEPVYHDEYVQYRLMNTAWSSVVSDWQGVDSELTAGSRNLVERGVVQNEFALGAVYDVSAKNPTAGPNNDGKFESLSALLSDANLNTLIPTAARKGGMSIKFIQSSDNKYVQYRYMGTETTGNPNPFLDTANWQGVDTKITNNSKNLAESGAVANELLKYKNLNSYPQYIGWLNGTQYIIDGDLGKHIVVDCVGEHNVKAGSYGRGATRIYPVKSYPSVITNHLPADFAGDLTTGYQMIDSTIEFTTPNDTKYLVITSSALNTGNTALPTTMKVDGYELCKDIIENVGDNVNAIKNIEDNIEDIETEVEEIGETADKAVTPQQWIKKVGINGIVSVKNLNRYVAYSNNAWISSDTGLNCGTMIIPDNATKMYIKIQNSAVSTITKSYLAFAFAINENYNSPENLILTGYDLIEGNVNTALNYEAILDIPSTAKYLYTATPDGSAFGNIISSVQILFMTDEQLGGLSEDVNGVTMLSNDERSYAVMSPTITFSNDIQAFFKRHSGKYVALKLESTNIKDIRLRMRNSSGNTDITFSNDAFIKIVDNIKIAEIVIHGGDDSSSTMKIISLCVMALSEAINNLKGKIDDATDIAGSAADAANEAVATLNDVNQHIDFNAIPTIAAYSESTVRDNLKVYLNTCYNEDSFVRKFIIDAQQFPGSFRGDMDIKFVENRCFIVWSYATEGSDSAINPNCRVVLTEINPSTWQQVNFWTIAKQGDTLGSITMYGGAGSSTMYIAGTDIHIIFAADIVSENSHAYVEMTCKFDTTNDTISDYNVLTLTDGEHSGQMNNITLEAIFGDGWDINSAWNNFQCNTRVAYYNGIYYAGFCYGHNNWEAPHRWHGFVASTTNFKDFTLVTDVYFGIEPEYELTCLAKNGYLYIAHRPHFRSPTSEHVSNPVAYGILAKWDIENSKFVDVVKFRNCSVKPCLFTDGDSNIYLSSSARSGADYRTRNKADIIQVDEKQLLASRLMLQYDNGALAYPSIEMYNNEYYVTSNGGQIWTFPIDEHFDDAGVKAKIYGE